jgi:hypothetical protein
MRRRGWLGPSPSFAPIDAAFLEDVAIRFIAADDHVHQTDASDPGGQQIVPATIAQPHLQVAFDRRPAKNVGPEAIGRNSEVAPL